MRCWKPSTIPRTSHPEFRASIVAAEMTEFIPGAGPPPHRIPSFTPPSSSDEEILTSERPRRGLRSALLLRRSPRGSPQRGLIRPNVSRLT
jgi:hypothetical protein